MTIQETLEKLGLSNNEVKVYLILLGIGSCLASVLAKKANMHRRTVYDTLDLLENKGLVSYSILSGKKYFQVADPSKLMGMADEIKDDVNKAVSELNVKFKLNKPRIFVETYEGVEGFKTIMSLILKEGKEWLTIGSTGKALLLAPIFLEQFVARREKLKINRKILIANNKQGKDYSKLLKKQKFVEVKFLPENIEAPQTIWIFGDKVAIHLISEEFPVSTLIDNKQIADSYRGYFNILWKK